MKGKVLVTGGSGRVGRVLIENLLKRAYEVRLLKHKKSLEEFEDQIQIVEGDITDYRSIEEAARDVDIVCHLAALMEGDPFSIFEVNVRGTLNLLEIARQMKDLRRFIFPSSDATYPTGWTQIKYKAPIDENQPQWPCNFYGISKLIDEVMCVQYQNLYKVPVVRLRFAWIFSGVEILDLFSPKKWLDFMTREDRENYESKDVLVALYEEDGTPYRDHVVDARDIVQGIMLCLEKDVAIGQVFNLAGPAPFSYEEEAEYLSKVLEKPCVRIKCKTLFSYELSIAKARNLLGFTPKYDVRKMLEEALAEREKHHGNWLK